MIRVTKQDVDQISYLARLKISEKEFKKYQDELSAILEYADLINKADVSGIKPMVNITGLSDVVRNDEKHPSELLRGEVLSNAPDKKDGYIKVKSVLN